VTQSHLQGGRQSQRRGTAHLSGVYYVSLPERQLWPVQWRCPVLRLWLPEPPQTDLRRALRTCTSGCGEPVLQTEGSGSETSPEMHRETGLYASNKHRIREVELTNTAGLMLSDVLFC